MFGEGFVFSQPDLKKIKISSSHCTALFVLTQNSYSVIEGDHNYFSQCCKNASIVEAEQNIIFSHHQISVLFLDAFQFNSLPSRSHDFQDLQYIWLAFQPDWINLWKESVWNFCDILHFCSSDSDWNWFCHNSGNSPGRPPGPGFPVDEHKNWQFCGRQKYQFFFFIDNTFFMME